jgi:hypothetical protein
MRKLIFVSGGDRMETSMHARPRDYDLYICYYGKRKQQDAKLRELADYYCTRKGSKFQNFHYLWETVPEIRNYDQYAILDDDIRISREDLQLLFDILSRCWILQPSFDSSGVISHKITRHKPGSKLRYVNFIEVTCMFISGEVIGKCMEAYSPELIGWGIDYLFIQVLGKDRPDKYIIVDEVKVTNPARYPREISLVEGYRNRATVWDTFAQSRGLLKLWPHLVF